MSTYEYWTLQQIVDSNKYPFTYGQMRYYTEKRDINGLEKAVRKIGKRIYFRIDLFEEWIESKQESDQW